MKNITVVGFSKEWERQDEKEEKSQPSHTQYYSGSKSGMNNLVLWELFHKMIRQLKTRTPQEPKNAPCFQGGHSCCKLVCAPTS